MAIKKKLPDLWGSKKSHFTDRICIAINGSWKINGKRSLK